MHIAKVLTSCLSVFFRFEIKRKLRLQNRDKEDKKVGTIRTEIEQLGTIRTEIEQLSARFGTYLISIGDPDPTFGFNADLRTKSMRILVDLDSCLEFAITLKVGP